MHVYRGLPPELSRCPSAVAVGNFDGVHLGHRTLLDGVVEAAEARGLVPSVVTFEPHPKEFFGRAHELTRISTLYDKVLRMREAGIERIYMLPFNAKLAAMSAEDFVRDILLEGLDTRWLTVGTDFRFGGDRKGDTALLEAMGQTEGFEVYPAPMFFHADARVSSSRIREALAAGDLYEASLMLGRPYSMTGRVIHGAQLGRTLGFPTLNLAPIPPGSHARPAVSGVFAVRIRGLEEGRVLRGVASVGIKPTVTERRQWLVETHIFDWAGDAYGRLVEIEFVERLRGEKKFSGLDELRTAIEADVQQAHRILGGGPL